MAIPKPKKQNTFIDMTAMSDVTVLLLTFFMTTATFIPKEPIQVFTPSSVVDIKVPDANLMTILIKPETGVYISLDRPSDKRAMLDMVAREYGITFSNQQIASFINQPIIGVPVGQLPAFLDLPLLAQDEYLKTSAIPTDSLNNQLGDWILRATTVNQDLRIALKADRSTPYPVVSNVISTLQDMKQNRFHLMTTLEGMPEGF